MYPFCNLVFEGGGVKGLAYVGAMEVLQAEGILGRIHRVGGTSAGAINATLFALGYSLSEQNEILRGMNFKSFMDDEWGIVRDSERLLTHFGWYKGDFFHQWISKLIEEKTGSPTYTFGDLWLDDGPELYMCATNVSTGYMEIFSHELTPELTIADAVRASMSIPLFFQAVRGASKGWLIDGGVLCNYPIKLFDRLKYISPIEQEAYARFTDYYTAHNSSEQTNKSNPWIFNRQTLGFRLDSKKEIGILRDSQKPEVREINDLFDFVKCLMSTLIDAQDNSHLHSDDWQRTVYIDTLGVGTTDFDISDGKKTELIASGKAHTQQYLDWWKREPELVNKLAPVSASKVS